LKQSFKAPRLLQRLKHLLQRLKHNGRHMLAVYIGLATIDNSCDENKVRFDCYIHFYNYGS
jgi:hypothetical protein